MRFRGESLIGVSVTLLSTNKGVVTDLDGKFKLQISGDNPMLIFSYLGYKKLSVPVGAKQEVNVKLNADAVKLSEVTVTVGYGTQKKREVTGAVGSVSGDQMERHPSGDINTSLQGKIAGLQITSNSGEPGAGATVRIRGASSVNGSSQPLYIVDGVPINTETYGGTGGTFEDASTFSPLADINPSDIESIEVLKDGTASIYGSRASNGVILITTKSGKNSKKPTLRFSTNTSLAELGRTVDVLNAPQWRSAYTDAIYNSTGQMTTKQSVIDSINPLLPFKSVNYLNGDIENPEEECSRYASLLKKYPTDIIFMGIGENGYLAFNDPSVADFNDPKLVKVVELDEVCRQQQVNDGCFTNLDAVPLQALTLTLPCLTAAKCIFCMVPGLTKSKAIKDTINQPIVTQYPSTILRKHPNAILFLDNDSSNLLKKYAE